MHEPFCGEVGRRGDRQHAGALPLQQAFRARRNAVESIAHDFEIAAARLRDDEPLSLPVEELQPELGLERLYLMADGTLGDAQFLGGPGEAFMAGGGPEGPGGSARGGGGGGGAGETSAG